MFQTGAPRSFAEELAAKIDRVPSKSNVEDDDAEPGNGDTL